MNTHLAGRGLLKQRVPALLVRREQRLHGRLRGPRRVGRLRIPAAAAAAAAAERLGGVQLQDLPRAQTFRPKKWQRAMGNSSCWPPARAHALPRMHTPTLLRLFTVSDACALRVLRGRELLEARRHAATFPAKFVRTRRACTGATRRAPYI